jgi:hypothetical protein
MIKFRKHEQEQNLAPPLPHPEIGWHKPKTKQMIFMILYKPVLTSF